MKKVEYLNSKEVSELLGISTTNLYGWSQEDRKKKRPFFPKPQKLMDNNGRRLVYKWKKKDVMKFVEEAKENPYYLLSEANYEKFKQKQNDNKPFQTLTFNELNKLMYQLKKRREAKK